MSSTEIKLVQKPIIQHALVEVGKSVTLRILELNLENLVATDETVKALKTLRIELNKEFEVYETQRKAIKDAVSNPYLEFDAVYKTEISEKYKKAVETLKDKIAIVEDKIKSEKKANIQRYFNEMCAAENIDFLKFENVGLEINLSTSEKQYREKCNEFVQRVADDILLIAVQEHEVEIMVEYKKTLNASKAITAITERKASEKLQVERIKQAETNRRQTLLRGLSMAYFDMTKTFNWASDDSVNITLSDIENLSKYEFQVRFVELEIKTKPVITQQTTAGEMLAAVFSTPAPAPGLFNQMTNGTPGISTPATKPITTPISAPTVAAPAEKTFTASFECVGTMSQLKALGNYMKENNIIYKNI